MSKLILLLCLSGLISPINVWAAKSAVSSWRESLNIGKVKILKNHKIPGVKIAKEIRSVSVAGNSPAQLISQMENRRKDLLKNIGARKYSQNKMNHQLENKTFTMMAEGTYREMSGRKTYFKEYQQIKNNSHDTIDGHTQRNTCSVIG